MSEIGTDELEGILSEKLEKDEEWRILEIEEVKPVNLGKLKKAIEKLSSFLRKIRDVGLRLYLTLSIRSTPK